MGSTFMGLEASKRGLTTQQSALYTTGHNISNANTLGYSRQRVNMEATLGYPGTGLNAPKIPGHLGTGVQAQSIQRIRDTFIDRQYRQETTKLGYWESRANAISQMEDIMSEPSDYGLNEALDQFWNSLQDLSGSPENAATRKVVIQRALHVADSFNYMHKQLSDIQSNLGNEIKVSTGDINSLLKQIASLNEQIQAIEPNGYMPNDLYDARDVLIDELSEYFPIETVKVPSGGNALPIAEGSLTIKIKINGSTIDLVKGKDYATLTAIDTAGKEIDGTDLTAGFDHILITGRGSVTGDRSPNGGNAPIGYAELDASKGKLLSLIDSYGHGNPIEGYYPDTLEQLNDMANAFKDEFNRIHRSGFTLEEDGNPSINGIDFFDTTSSGAFDIKVLDAIINNPNLIAVSDAQGEEGNGKKAIELANMKFNKLSDLDGATVQSFYQGIIGQLGVDGEQANRLTYNATSIRLTVENNRASVSSVSLDEEMTNMITFQQAYNANARMITVIDETLDKIINGMGRVGL